FASLIRGTEFAEMYIFPIAADPAFCGIGTPAMGKLSAAYAAETTKVINYLDASCQYGHFITRRVESFCFSASQRKAKKTKNSALSATLR
ncbi:MAG: hypothetical protein KKH68_01645, partial [Proteobacteria bacterium]|nr:hypothetical protein [Pseudomonadota bacterium]